MARTYRFSVLRVSPDLRRGETVNVGLIVFGSSRVDVRVLPSLAKVQAIDGTVDVAQVYGLTETLPQFLRSFQTEPEQLEALAELGFISASSPGEFEAHDQDAYEAVVDDLMTRLVRPPRVKRAVLRESRLTSDIRHRLTSKHWLGRRIDDIDRHLVVPNFPVSEQLDLYADFAARNGAMHTVKVIDFRVKNASSPEKFREACSISLHNIKAKEEFVGPRRFVVYAADTDTEISVERHLSVLADDADYLLNYESDEDRGFFLGEMGKVVTGQSELVA